MKTFICNQCVAYGGTACCFLAEDDIPTHCPCTDSKNQYAEWREKDAQSGDLITDKKLCDCGRELPDMCEVCLRKFQV